MPDQALRKKKQNTRNKSNQSRVMWIRATGYTLRAVYIFNPLTPPSSDQSPSHCGKVQAYN